MSTDHAMQIRGIKVQVVRKAIKNLHLGVYPPNGRVRVAAPTTVSNDAVRLAVIGKFGWISRMRRKFLAQPRQSKREMVSGESHYFLGRRYRLRVVELEGAGAQRVVKRPSLIELHVRAETTSERREALLDGWYREQLREVVTPLMAQWQERLGVTVRSWSIKRMKTKWGSCSPRSGRVLLNLDLARSPVECIEYIVVHELVHFLAPRHDDQFFAQLDRHLPGWRSKRDVLNLGPLPHVQWS